MLHHSFSGFGEQLDHAQHFGLTYVWEDGRVTSTLPNPYFHFVFVSSYLPKHTHTHNTHGSIKLYKQHICSSNYAKIKFKSMSIAVKYE